MKIKENKYRAPAALAHWQRPCARRRVATAGRGGGGHPVATRPCMASRAAGAPAGDAKRPPAHVDAPPCAALVQGTGGGSAAGTPATRAPRAPMSTPWPLYSGGVGAGGSTEPLTVLVSREPKHATRRSGPIKGEGALPPASIRSVNAGCGVACTRAVRLPPPGGKRPRYPGIPGGLHVPEAEGLTVTCLPALARPRCRAVIAGGASPTDAGGVRGGWRRTLADTCPPTSRREVLAVFFRPTA